MKRTKVASSGVGLFTSMLLLLPGCVDPEGKFDEFEERVGPFEGGIIGEGGIGGPCTVIPDQVEGSYLLALSVSLQPGTPIVALLELSTPAFEGGAGVAFEGQVLSASDRRTPVGDPISAGPFPVMPDGSFTMELSGLMVAGEANAISGGPIAADATLAGNLCGDGSFFCGVVEGTVTAPLTLDLQGSTFTLTRVDDPANPPTQPAIDCAGTLADPV